MDFFRNQSFKSQVRKIFKSAGAGGGLKAMAGLSASGRKLYFGELRRKNVQPAMVATILLAQHIRIEAAINNDIDLGKENSVIAAVSLLGLDFDDLQQHGLMKEDQFFQGLYDVSGSKMTGLA